MYALIDSNGIVQNIIIWDGETEYTPPTGQTLVEAPSGTKNGATYANGVFTNPVEPTPIPVVIPLAIQAQTLLDKTDITVLRCYSAGVAVPAEWQAYRVALRAIVTGKDTTSTSLPTAPQTYPAGT